MVTSRRLCILTALAFCVFMAATTCYLSKARVYNVKQQRRQIPNALAPGHNNVGTPGESFAGCLLTRDDNQLLVEWIAYHYHVMPLRRLIIAADPLSVTSVYPVTNRWKHRMSISVWNDSYIGLTNDSFVVARHERDPQRAQVGVHRTRQRKFYARCMQQLKLEDRHWVQLIDTDEFALVNPRVSSGAAGSTSSGAESREQPSLAYHPNVTGPLFDIANGGSVLHTLRVTSMPTKQYSITSPACVPAKRVFFGDHPSSMLEMQDQFPVSLVGLNPNELVTFRWRHADAREFKPGKAMVDVSKVGMTELEGVVSCHRPVANHCPSWNSRKGSLPRDMTPLIIVHHYSGSAEQRAARFTWNHLPKAKRSSLHNGVQMWLRGFVASVGPREALHLLSPPTTPSPINSETPYSEPGQYDTAPVLTDARVARGSAAYYNERINKTVEPPPAGARGSGPPTNTFTGLPIIVVGMPKVGTTTITKYFECSGRYSVSHHFCKPGRSGLSKCGVIIKKNVEAGRLPLTGIDNFDVYAQLDAWALTTRRLFDYRCYMPQVEDLEKLHAQFPNATLILNTRNVDHWVKSLHSFNKGNMLQQMIECNITALPAGVGGNDTDLKMFYQGHTDNIQSFVKSHPSHGLVTIDIENWDAGEILEEAFKINRTCWGHANKS